MSAAGPIRSPRACSGAMYCGVPSTTPVLVSSEPSASFAIPKSSSFGNQVPSRSAARKTLSGLRSRCVIPALRGVERVGDAPQDGDDRRERQPPPAPAQLAQREAVEQLHDEVVPLLLRQHAEGEDIDDVALADPVHRARLGDEPGDGLRLRGEPPVQDLDGDLLADERVLAGIDLSKGARAELPLDAVLADHGVRREERLGGEAQARGQERIAVGRTRLDVFIVHRTALGARRHTKPCKRGVAWSWLPHAGQVVAKP
ncbi:hypothetical protein BE20_23555 [Sorangium cellulosum]|nr:hypothetical protein BE20_23555 [Sorangium cellulosum]